jgi:hypothetical protein
MKQGLMADAQKLKEAHDSVMAMLESKVEQGMSDAETKMLDKAKKEMEKMMNPMMAEHEEMMGECEAKMGEMEGMHVEHKTEMEDHMSDMMAIIPVTETPESVRDKLESINVEDDKLEMKAIKGLLEELKKLKRANGGLVMGGGGGRIVKVHDLSSQLNGVLTTFSLPAFWRVIDVKLSSLPVLRPTVDYTTDGTLKTVSFTSQVDTATQLSAGQSLLVIYSE